MNCPYHASCLFLKHATDRKSKHWVFLTSHYCHGSLVRFCGRLVEYEATGTWPARDVGPTGQLPSEIFNLP